MKAIDTPRLLLRPFVCADFEAFHRLETPPHGKGILGPLSKQGKPLRLEDLTADLRSVGFPPGGHSPRGPRWCRRRVAMISVPQLRSPHVEHIVPAPEQLARKGLAVA